MWCNGAVLICSHGHEPCTWHSMFCHGEQVLCSVIGQLRVLWVFQDKQFYLLFPGTSRCMDELGCWCIRTIAARYRHLRCILLCLQQALWDQIFNASLHSTCLHVWHLHTGKIEEGGCFAVPWSVIADASRKHLGRSSVAALTWHSSSHHALEPTYYLPMSASAPQEVNEGVFVFSKHCCWLLASTLGHCQP